MYPTQQNEWVDDPPQSNENDWVDDTQNKSLLNRGIDYLTNNYPGMALGRALFDTFAVHRLKQLAGQEPGVLNPDPYQNPLIAGANPVGTAIGNYVNKALGYNPNMQPAQPGAGMNYLRGVPGNFITGLLTPGNLLLGGEAGTLSSEPTPTAAELAAEINRRFGNARNITPVPKPEPKLLPAGPRFIAGRAGVAENRPYPIDIGPTLPNRGNRPLLNENNPETLTHPEGTILPREQEGIIQAPPEYVAENGLGFGQPISASRLNEGGWMDEGPEQMKVQGTNPDTGRSNIALGPEFSDKASGGRLFQVLATALYSKDRPTIVAKELIQNALDEHRISGNEHQPIKIVASDYGKNPATGQTAPHITVRDYGRGMDPNVLYNAFSNIGETGKLDESGASGGFGVAKAAPFLSGEYTETRTVVNENGKKYEYRFAATPEQIQNQEVGVPLERIEVSPDTPTGTQVSTWFEKKTDTYKAIKFIRALAENSSELKSGIQLTTPYHDILNDNAGKLFLSGATPKNNLIGQFKEGTDYEHLRPEPMPPLVDTLDSPTASVDLHYENPAEGMGANNYDIAILNKGLFQGVTRNYYPGRVKGPTRIVANIRSKVNPGESGYPFTMNREQLPDEITEAINKWVEDNIISGFISKNKDRLTQMYANMKAAPVQGTTYKPLFFDETGKLSPHDTTDILSKPVTHNLIQFFDKTMKDMVNHAQRVDIDQRLEGVGMGFMPNSHGLHVPNPNDNGKTSSIIINPFPSILNNNPSEAASNIMVTMLHELAHVPKIEPNSSIHLRDIDHPEVGPYVKKYMQELLEQGKEYDPGHGMVFVKNLADVFASYGAENYVNAKNELESILTGSEPFGNYSPEIEDILSKYARTVRGTGSSENLLSATGVKSETSRKGEGILPSDPNGSEGRTLAELYDQVFNQQPNVASVTPRQPTNQPPNNDLSGTPIRNLTDALRDARNLRGEQEEIYRTERAERIGNASKIKIKGEGDVRKVFEKVAGEHTKVQFESIRPSLSQDDIDSMFRLIKNSNLTEFDKLPAYRGLLKLLGAYGGHVPQHGELNKLVSVFKITDPEGAAELKSLIDAKRYKNEPLVVRAGRIASNATFDAAKELSASMDVSAPFRQGLGLIHKKAWWTSWDDMFKSFGSEAAYKGVMQSIYEHPLYQDALNAGIQFTDTLNEREDMFLKNWVENVPGLGSGVRASNRAYTAFLNKVRMDTFASMYKDMKASGILGRQGYGFYDKHVIGDLGRFINTATGRGDMYHLGQKSGDAFIRAIEPLNKIFFSPRMIASRLAILNPRYYIQLAPPVRKEALKSLMAMVSAGMTITGLGILAGGSTSLDPRSSDFMKLVMGNTRIDPFAGLQQYVVQGYRFSIAPLVRLLSGNYDYGDVVSTSSGKEYKYGVGFGRPTMKDAAEDFGARKLAPQAAFIYKMWQQHDARGHYYNIPQEQLKAYIPLILQDMYSVAQDDPSLLPITVPASATGIGIQTYDSGGKF